ncbi:EamA/RhaT family transporter, partial [Burkholderia pseudomallei]|nr:EamA/RhaT family transporter [Burkholderia pseudomallei]
LLYAFVYDHRLPRVLEIAALVLLLAGVYGSVRQHSNTHSDDDPLNANLTAH